MVEEAIRGTSTLDLILTKKKKIVGEMKLIGTFRESYYVILKFKVIKEGKLDFKIIKEKRYGSMG